MESPVLYENNYLSIFNFVCDGRDLEKGTFFWPIHCSQVFYFLSKQSLSGLLEPSEKNQYPFIQVGS